MGICEALQDLWLSDSPQVFLIRFKHTKPLARAKLEANCACDLPEKITGICEFHRAHLYSLIRLLWLPWVAWIRFDWISFLIMYLRASVCLLTDRFSVLCACFIVVRCHFLQMLKMLMHICLSASLCVCTSGIWALGELRGNLCHGVGEKASDHHRQTCKAFGVSGRITLTLISIYPPIDCCDDHNPPPAPWFITELLTAPVTRGKLLYF